MCFSGNGFGVSNVIILGFSQLLKMDEDLALPEISKSNIDHIITAGYHLFALVEDVLDVSRIEAGKLSLKIENIEVPPLFK